MNARDKLSTTGVWYHTDTMSAGESGEFAQRLESLGYSALWIPDTLGRDPMVNASTLLRATDNLLVATGIANIHMRHPGAMKAAAAALGELSGDRFVLGLGVSHAPMVEGLRGIPYGKPLQIMRSYVEGIKNSMYMGAGNPDGFLILIAALGPKMLELAGEVADGAHPYWTTPEHTASAREILGPDALLCVEQKVVLTTDRAVAHERTNEQLSLYATLPNYRNSWLRLGFTEDEIDQRQPRFLDAVMAWGDADAVRARVQAHYDAGATHVCVQPINANGNASELDWNLLGELAPTP